MILKKHPLNAKQALEFNPLLVNGVVISFVESPNLQDDSTHPVFLAEYSGKCCLFPYVNEYAPQQLEFEIENIWNYLKD